MRIVLVQPPIRDFYDTDVRLQPIGLAYLKATLQRHRPEVDVIIRDYHRTGEAAGVRCRRSRSVPLSRVCGAVKR